MNLKNSKTSNLQILFFNRTDEIYIRAGGKKVEL